MAREKQFDINDGLDKAMQQFWRRGYEATSVQDLVDTMGVNRASLYGTYGDKRELFLKSLTLYDQKMCFQALKELETKFSPLQAVRRLFEGFAEPALAGCPAKGCFITNSSLELAAHDPEIRKITADSQMQIEAFFVRMIKAGQKSGEFAAGINAADTAQGLLASLQGLIVLTRSRPEKKLLETIIAEALGRLR